MEHGPRPKTVRIGHHWTAVVAQCGRSVSQWVGAVQSQCVHLANKFEMHLLKFATAAGRRFARMADKV